MAKILVASGITLLLFFMTESADAKSQKKKNLDLDQMMSQLAEEIAFDSSNVEKPLMVGVASWYGRGFHGRRTANGERYNMHALTCASRDLPFGTLLEVTNLENGEKAVVRVNDRGPVPRSRILDLSYGTAKKLGFLRKGKTKVEVRLATEEIIHTGSKTRPEKDPHKHF